MPPDFSDLHRRPQRGRWSHKDQHANWWVGVNLNGGEYGGTFPSSLGAGQYTYPLPGDLDYIKGKYLGKNHSRSLPLGAGATDARRRAANG